MQVRTSWDFSQLPASSPLHLNTQLSLKIQLPWAPAAPNTALRAGGCRYESSSIITPGKAIQSVGKASCHSWWDLHQLGKQELCSKACKSNIYMGGSAEIHVLTQGESSGILNDPTAFHRLQSVSCRQNHALVWAGLHFKTGNYTLFYIYRYTFIVISVFFLWCYPFLLLLPPSLSCNKKIRLYFHIIQDSARFCRRKHMRVKWYSQRSQMIKENLK